MIAEIMSRLPFIMPAGLVPKIMRNDVENWYEQLVLEDAPPSAMKFFRWLDQHGRYRTAGEMHRYAYGATKKIAGIIKAGDPTIREYAIPWLVENGWLFVEDVEVDGRKQKLWWCLWLLPFDLTGRGVDMAGFAVDLGGGMAPCSPQAERKPTRKKAARQPLRADFEPHCAENGRPKTAPTKPYGLEDNNRKTTTDREDAGAAVVVVEAAPDRGGEKAAGPPPALTLAPELAELLSEVAAPGRPSLAAKVAEWCHRHPIDRVVRAILATIKADREGKVTKTFIAYAQGTLNIMALEGDAEIKATPVRRGPSPEEAAAAQAERLERRRTEARADAINARWKSLSEAERTKIFSEWDLANPRPPGMNPHVWAGMRNVGVRELWESKLGA